MAKAAKIFLFVFEIPLPFKICGFNPWNQVADSPLSHIILHSTELCYTGCFSPRTYVKSHVRSDSTLGPLELILLLCTSFSFARGVSGIHHVVFDCSASGWSRLLGWIFLSSVHHLWWDGIPGHLGLIQVLVPRALIWFFWYATVTQKTLTVQAPWIFEISKINLISISDLFHKL